MRVCATAAAAAAEGAVDKVTRVEFGVTKRGREGALRLDIEPDLRAERLMRWLVSGGP